jgi:hypothetical protein
MWLRVAATVEDWDTYKNAYKQDRQACKEAFKHCKDPYMRKRLKTILQLMDVLYGQQQEQQRAA